MTEKQRKRLTRKALDDLAAVEDDIALTRTELDELFALLRSLENRRNEALERIRSLALPGGDNSRERPSR